MIKPKHETLLKCERILHAKLKQVFYTDNEHVIGCVLSTGEVMFVDVAQDRRTYPGQAVIPMTDEVGTAPTPVSKPRRKRHTKSSDS